MSFLSLGVGAIVALAGVGGKHKCVSGIMTCMTIWESGRESKLLDDIIAGRKTVEGRLKRGKFAQYCVGDIIKLRRDIRDQDGVLCDGELDQARVKIVVIREYPNFLSLCQAEGYRRVIPHAASVVEAADEYNKYYSTNEQVDCGVLAVEIRTVHC